MYVGLGDISIFNLNFRSSGSVSGSVNVGRETCGTNYNELTIIDVVDRSEVFNHPASIFKGRFDKKTQHFNK